MANSLTKIIIFLFFCLNIPLIALASPTNDLEGIQFYRSEHKHLNPIHKQKLADDIDRFQNADNLWDALREEFNLEHYESNPAVQAKINWYMNNQGFLYRSASRASPYLYYILQQIKKRHLPAELVLLPIIESGYNPFSISTVGAAGIWQLMPATAAGLGVRQDWWYDGRRDVITSTRAALNHLSYLQKLYDGNWLLALAAYDTGEGNLSNAIQKNIRNGYDTEFWSLPVAAETRNYVPSLLAVAIIISHPERYPVSLPPVRNAPYLAQVEVGAQIHLQIAAAFAGISYKRLKQLNSGYNQLLTPSKGPNRLMLPIEHVEQFIENLVRSPLNNGIKWVHYRTHSGDTLASIAKKFHTTPEAIKGLNHLAKNNVNSGSNLLISTDLNKPIKTPVLLPEMRATTLATKRPLTSTPARIPLPEIFVDKKMNYKIQPGDTVYMVRQHDTLQHIAKRFAINAEFLRIANNLPRNHSLTPGKQIIIPTHPKQQNSSLMPGDTLYMIRKGDSLEKIANKFNTSPAAIRLANLIDENSLHEGQRIVVPTHIRG